MNPAPYRLPRFAEFSRVWPSVFLALAASPAVAGQPAPRTYADRQIVVPQMAVRDQASVSPPQVQDETNRLRSGRQRSLVQQAAYSEGLEELPPRLLKPSAVQQASYGCSCGQCVGAGEPSCGYEEMEGYEVGCGAESWSVDEASCGWETTPGAGGCDACGEPACGGACGTDCYNFCLPIFRLQWCRFEFFAGVNGFTGPANYANTAAPTATTPAGSRVGSSSFGFYEGVNEGRSLKGLFGLDLAGQLGVRGTQTSLSGTEFTDDTRNQVFVTGGLFRRVDFGLQYGVVVDYLNDDWWFHNDLVQLRGELSWNDGCAREFGYQFMAGVDDSTSETSVITATGTRFRSTVSFEPTDQHRFFFRGSTGGGGQYFAFVGGTDRSDGLLGAGMSTAARRGMAFQAGATYLIPNEGRRNGGNENENWNLSMGVIFRPGGKQACGRYCRPMFDVADNGTFMIDRL